MTSLMRYSNLKRRKSLSHGFTVIGGDKRAGSRNIAQMAFKRKMTDDERDRRAAELWVNRALKYDVRP